MFIVAIIDIVDTIIINSRCVFFLIIINLIILCFYMENKLCLLVAFQKNFSRKNNKTSKKKYQKTTNFQRAFPWMIIGLHIFKTTLAATYNPEPLLVRSLLGPRVEWNSSVLFASDLKNGFEKLGDKNLKPFFREILSHFFAEWVSSYCTIYTSPVALKIMSTSFTIFIWKQTNIQTMTNIIKKTFSSCA